MNCTQKKKLYINARFLSQNFTGVQRYAAELVQEMDNLIAENSPITENFEIVLLSPKNVNQSLELKHIKIKSVGMLSGHLWEQLELPIYIKNGILFCPGNMAPIFSLLSKTPVITTIHSISFKFYPSNYSSPYRIWYRLITPIIFRLSDIIITVSNSEKEYIKNSYNFNRNKIHVIQNGGPFKEFYSVLNIESAKQNLHAKAYILFVGSLNKIKNLKSVIDAFELLQNDINCDLLVIGENTKTFHKSRISVPLIKKNKVIFKGQINNSEELINLYKNAICLVFPSLYEASPLPPIEAMACGCPVIASNIPSLKERCGDAAIYCHPEDVNDIAKKILKVINDKKLRESYIKKGLLKTRDYTWKKCTEETLKLIKKLG